MPRFSQQVIGALANPQYGMLTGQAIANVGQRLSEIPANIRAERERQRLLQEEAAKKEAQRALFSAYASGDPTQMSQVAGQYGATVPEMGVQVLGRAEDVAQQRAAETRRNNLITAAQSKAKSQQKSEGFISGLSGVSTEQLEKYLFSDEEPKTAKFGMGITEWTDQTGNVVLQTLQTDAGKTYRVGDTSTPLTSQDFVGLTKIDKPGVSISMGEKGDQEYLKTLGQGLAEADLDAITAVNSALDNMSVISEARLTLEQTPEVLGIGAESIDTAKKGVLRLMQGLGVSESEPLYKKISEQSSAVDLYRVFQQEFVKQRLEATKGAVSDREYQSFLASVPGLLQTPEGYKQVLDYMERISTAAIIKGNHIENAINSDDPRTASKKAREDWANFSRDFPLGSLDSKSMSPAFQDYIKPGFNKENMAFSIIGPDGKERTTTYKDIVKAGREQGRSAALSIKTAFEAFGAQYIPMSIR